MATSWCLPKKETAALLEALRSHLSPERLMGMTSDARRAEFAKIVGDENAHEINARFESKLLLKNQKLGLTNWVNKLGTVSEPVRRDLVSKINKLDRVLSPEDKADFLSDLAAQKLGVGVTSEEAGTVFKLAQEAKVERDAPTASLSGVSDAYLAKANALKGYLESLKPTSTLKSIGFNAAVIARNNLLFNPSTPIKTIIGQAENAVMDFFTRRVGSMSASSLNADLASSAQKEAWATYRKTGVNTAAMESLDDTGQTWKNTQANTADAPAGWLGAVERGVGKAAALSNKAIIDWAHAGPFTKFYQQSFYDMANVFSSNMARSEGLTGEAAQARAEEIFRDAAKIKPETAEGANLRRISQQQAARVTSTNETIASRLAVGVRDAMNKAFGGLGDLMMPIMKIPANIIWNGVENAGPGLPIGVVDIFKGRAKIQSADLATRYEGMAQFSGGIQKVARTFGTLGTAALFASQLTPADFKQDRFGASFVKIGSVWINMEYISAISPALAGMMTVKMKGKPGQGLVTDAAQYSGGTLSALKNVPGVHDVGDLIDSLSNVNAATKMRNASTFFTSRAVPAFISNLFKDRPIDRLFFGAHGVETEGDEAKDKYDLATQKTQDNMTVWGDPHAQNADKDPTNQYLERIGYIPSFPKDTINGVKLSQAQYDEYVQKSGRLAKMMLDQVSSNGAQSQAPLAWQKNSVKRTIEIARKSVATQIMMEDPSIATKSQAAKMLRMTQQVPAETVSP